jgi:hypothetical protein
MEHLGHALRFDPSGWAIAKEGSFVEGSFVIGDLRRGRAKVRITAQGLDLIAIHRHGVPYVFGLPPDRFGNERDSRHGFVQWARIACLLHDGSDVDFFFSLWSGHAGDQPEGVLHVRLPSAEDARTLVTAAGPYLPGSQDG